MKNILIAAICAVMLASGMSYGETKDPAQGNLVTNGSFEVVKDKGLPEKWAVRNTEATGSKMSIKVDKQESYKGLQAVVLENTAAKGLVVLQSVDMIALSPGARYSLSGYVKVDMDSIEPNVSKKDMKRLVYLMIQSYDEKQGYANIVECKPMIAATTTGWVEVKAENITLPEKCKYAQIWCVVNGGYARAWFDNVTLTRTDQ